MSEQRGGSVRMALRDASWYNRPNTRSPKVYHVLADDLPFFAVCSGAPLVEETECSVAAVPPGLRCRRRACRSRWEAAPIDGSVTP